MASPIGAAGSDLGGRGGGVALDLDQEGEEGGAHDGDGDGRSEIRTVVPLLVTVKLYNFPCLSGRSFSSTRA